MKACLMNMKEWGPLPDRRTEAEFAGDANREWVSYLKVEYWNWLTHDED